MAFEVIEWRKEARVESEYPRRGWRRSDIACFSVDIGEEREEREEGGERRGRAEAGSGQCLGPTRG